MSVSPKKTRLQISNLRPAIARRIDGTFNSSFMGSMSVRGGSLSSSLLISPQPRKGVRINEAFNSILEISTRSIRVERGDLDLFYPADYEPDPVYECYLCKTEAENDNEAGKYRIYNLPNGSWRLLCTQCNPPDSSWVFDRTVLVSDWPFPADIIQRIYLFAGEKSANSYARVCRLWYEMSWTTLTLRDNDLFTSSLNDQRWQNVWNLNFIISQPYSATQFLDAVVSSLPNIRTLLELTVSGLSTDNQILALAEGIRDQQCLCLINLSGCVFSPSGLNTILSALEENLQPQVTAILPKKCMDYPQKSYSTIEAAEQALEQLVSGTNIQAILV